MSHPYQFHSISPVVAVSRLGGNWPCSLVQTLPFVGSQYLRQVCSGEEVCYMHVFASLVLDFDVILLEPHYHSLKASWCASKQFVQVHFEGLVVAVDSDLPSKSDLVGIRDGQHLLLYLGVTCFSFCKDMVGLCYWLLVLKQGCSERFLTSVTLDGQLPGWVIVTEDWCFSDEFLDFSKIIL